MSPTLVRILRYPVKGLNGEALKRVALLPNRHLPGDRRFAIAHGAGMSPAPVLQWQPRDAFLMLARNERLALLDARYDSESGFLTLSRGGKQVARGDLRTPLGRMLIEQFLAAFMKTELRGAPKFVEVREGGFTDTPEGWLSIVNLASVRDLEARIARVPVDPIRFRANLYIDGIDSWRELNWTDREIRIGTVRLRVTRRIKRCAATNVNPKTGARDLNIPRTLTTGVGHCDMGIYAEVLNAGEINLGDSLTVPVD